MGLFDNFKLPTFTWPTWFGGTPAAPAESEGADTYQKELADEIPMNGDQSGEQSGARRKRKHRKTKRSKKSKSKKTGRKH